MITTKQVTPQVDPTTAIVDRMAAEIRIIGEGVNADAVVERTEFTRDEVKRYFAAACDQAKLLDRQTA